MREPWPHQKRGIEDVLAALARGERRVLLTAPTGGGKTFVMAALARHYLEGRRKVALYTNRKMLLDQTSDVLLEAGLYHGVRAAGHADERAHDFQVCSVQTEHARVGRAGIWDMHEAELVLVDEAHCMTGPGFTKLLGAHVQEGASCVGFTATPVGLGGLYDCLVVAGNNSALRACGALVPCLHYGPDEPDLRHVGKVAPGEDLSENQNVAAVMRPGIFGRVLDHYRRLNPEGKPAILFAPGVAESLWFAEQFHANGITAAHIDGQEVWVNGKAEKTSARAREDVLRGSRDGTVRVLCNRFVLREGIDAPWLAHGIFATVFGSLQSYLQAGGRLLRSHPGVPTVTVQDHGGNWWRHGSLNADRDWRLDDTPGRIAGLWADRGRSGDRPQPWCCPRCRQVLARPPCPCGWEPAAGRVKSRAVVQADGTLKEMAGDVYRPRRLTRRADAAKVWTRMYHRGRKAGMTFRQCEALFAQENRWGWPPRNLPLMPVADLDWFRLVADVPPERLVPKPPKE